MIGDTAREGMRLAMFILLGGALGARLGVAINEEIEWQAQLEKDRIDAERMKYVYEVHEAKALATAIVETAVANDKADEYWDGTPKAEEDKPVKKEPQQVVDYTAPAKKKAKKSGHVNPPIEEVAKLLEDEPVTKPLDGPELIREDQYGETGNELVQYAYYEADDVLADDDDKVIPNPEEVLGIDALVSFGKLVDDPDLVYVRDAKKGVDYEVTRSKKAFLVVALRYDENDARVRAKVAAVAAKRAANDNQPRKKTAKRAS
jgi:hypothetical protein